MLSYYGAQPEGGNGTLRDNYREEGKLTLSEIAERQSGSHLLQEMRINQTNGGGRGREGDRGKLRMPGSHQKGKLKAQLVG